MMKRSCLLAFAGLVVIGWQVSVPVKARAESTKINVAVLFSTLDGVLPQLAKDTGIFAKFGLDATFITVKSGPDIVPVIASGSADFTEVTPTTAFPAIARGAGITFLMNNYDIDYSLIARRDIPIDTSKPYPEIALPLKGKRIGVVGRGGVTEIFVRRIFTAAGMNPDTDATIIAVGGGATAVGAFEHDQVDAMVSLPPVDYLLKPDEYTPVVSLKTDQEVVFSKDFILTATAGNSAFIKKNPETTLKYCSAIKEANQYLHAPENRPKVVAYLAKIMNLPEDKASAMFKAYEGNWSIKLTPQRWAALKNYRDDVPTWDTAVFKPCADLSVE